MISGNTWHGILILDPGTTSNFVRNNFIGTDASGTGPIPNEVHGIEINLGANGNTIGGSVAGQGNVISGNDVHGINIVGVGADNNIIRKNRIGTDVSGTAPLPNGQHGIEITGGPQGNTIGGLSGEGILHERDPYRRGCA